ncbi:hypothetical protein Scep_000003 [Stephania cephalantha]|uniref:Uncharacterized protein n=1 Tax=Stephania cephalantha TaxID=152367 RepID=A0AAP0Q205_9MAGN
MNVSPLFVISVNCEVILRFCKALYDYKDPDPERKYGSLLEAPTRRSNNATTNRWLKGPEGQRFPVAGGDVDEASNFPNQRRNQSDWTDSEESLRYSSLAKQMRIELQSWPYGFTMSEDFPHSDRRGSVS